MERTDVLLSSGAYVKAVTNISENVAGKYILPSLREAQEIGLRGILGDTLLDYLKVLVAAGTLDDEGNEAYAALVDRCQYYLAYSTVAAIIPKVTWKVGNFGLTRTSDENLQPASLDEMDKAITYYQSKADACCLDLQNWLLNNRSSFPQLTAGAAHRIHDNLYSAASCGIFLGGPRGKGRPKKCGR